MAEIEFGSNFIREIIEEDLQTGKHNGRVATRFPPEPNGYLHIGHAKSICLNFGLARSYGGTCNLRFDDTDPVKEEQEYVDSIMEDVRWLGFEWDGLYYASDYFEQLYTWAQQLIREGLAYVDELSAEEIREYRGNFYTEGKNSPYRDRPASESLDLLARMRAGEFEDGHCVLRAKIDMKHPNINMRDPLIYRIKHATHHRTGDDWCIYPMYDFAHELCDAIERITHSVCTLEFEDHRIVYDWFLDALRIEEQPQQIEFAKLNLSYTVMSKRRLLSLVNEGYVESWDDPRMPTLSGLRRRGFTPEAIRHFCDRIGVNKRDSIVDIALLEHCVRDHLNDVAPRVMGILDPIKVIIDNYPENEEEWIDAPFHPTDETLGTRKLPFSRELYIDSSDFMEDPPKKFFRLAPGREVRLRYAYFIKCVSVEKDESGKIKCIHCTYDPESKGGKSPDGRKVKVTMHWLSAKHAIPAKLRLINHLFSVENPLEDAEKDFKDFINPDSMQILNGYVEPALAMVKPGYRCQFERMAYFCADKESTEQNLIFNRIVTMRDDWVQIQKKAEVK
ncbi:MAG: glutamine--tRNA ligase/YqeY domain fusion protein [Bradymonadales bacterium]|jgi:glutaminyl-tRNA synthetase